MLGFLNRILRWTGFVIVRHVDDLDLGPDRFVLTWIGFPPGRAWALHCERTRALQELADSGPLEGEALEAYEDLRDQLESALRTETDTELRG